MQSRPDMSAWSPRPLLVGARACAALALTWGAASGCNVLFGQTDLEVVADGTGASGTGGAGTGGMAADCPDGEQDNDADGTCEPECAADACSGNGTCDDSSGTATCVCDFRFDGDDCTDCAEGYAGSDCTACDDGYQDEDDDGTCSPECADATCSGNGDCDDSSGTATCTCRPTHGGDDCATACPTGMAGASCDFRIIYGLDIPEMGGDWNLIADVPYDIDEAASAGGFDRVAYRLILDDEEVWVELDPFTTDAAELGLAMDWIYDVPVSNVTVASFSANQATVTTPSDGNVEMWSNCYSAGPNGVFDYDDDIGMNEDCYGCIQVHLEQQTVLAFNRWARDAGGLLELGIGPSPTGNPDYTFEENAGDYTSRRLEVYIREP